MWQWLVTGLWRTSISAQDKQRMYLLSEPRGGRRPTTSGGPETLEIMCNLIFTQNKRRTDRERQHHKRGQKNGRPSWTGLSPKGYWAFSSQATQSHRTVPDSTHSSDTCINGILAWDCRCWKAIVQKQLCLSYSLFLSLSLSHTLRVSLLLTPLSSVCPPTAHTHTHTPPLFSIHSFSHYWSVSALENCCACRAGVITSGINHFPCAWLQEARLIPALLYTPSRSTDREKAYWLLLKAWYNSKCLPICGRLCSFWPYNKGTTTERAEIQT